MIYSLTINIDSERIVIISEDGSKLTDIPNIIALDDNDNIVSIGETQEDLQEKMSEDWDKVKTKIHFYNLFSPNGFRPKLGASTINFLAYLATHPTSKSQKSWLRDSIIMKINLEGYDKLNKNLQDLFEYYITRASFFRTKSLYVNNQSIEVKKIHLAEQSAKLSLPLFFMIIALAGFYLAEKFLTEQILAPVAGVEILLFLFLLIIFVTLFYYLSGFVCIIIWRIATKNLVSNSISKVIIEEIKMNLPKPFMNLLWNESVSQNIGG